MRIRTGGKLRGGSTARFVNGVISAIIVVFFLIHGVLGCVSVLTGYTGSMSVLVWCGVALIAVHVVASIVTSRQQLADVQFPPSARKKRHLALKWATGALLAAVVAAHVALPKSTVTAAVVIIAVSVVLAVHLCVGSKSLLKDLGIDRRYKTAFRVAVCLFAAVFVAVMLVAIMR